MSMLWQIASTSFMSCLFFIRRNYLLRDCKYFNINYHSRMPANLMYFIFNWIMIYRMFGFNPVFKHPLKWYLCCALCSVYDKTSVRFHKWQVSLYQTLIKQINLYYQNRNQIYNSQYTWKGPVSQNNDEGICSWGKINDVRDTLLGRVSNAWPKRPN